MQMLACLISCAAATSVSAQVATFVRLEAPPQFPGGFGVQGISGSGEFVYGTLGESQTTGRLARWSATAGFEVLSASAAGQFYIPEGASFSGDALVGTHSFLGAFRWRSSGIEFLPFSVAQACSADGNTVAGSNSNGTAMFTWSNSAGQTPVQPLPYTVGASFPDDMSADGAVVVGHRIAAEPGSPNIGHVFRWVAGVGTSPIQMINTWAAVSADGRSVVGSATGPARWTALHGVHVVAAGPEGRAISGDGWVIGGTMHAPTALEPAAFLWDPVHGVRNLKDYLISLGVTGLESWRLLEILDMSWDASVVVGRGIVGGGTAMNGTWVASIPRFCYANCDGSTIAPTMNVADFTCFLRKFAQNDVYANCDNDGSLSVADFTCFLQKFAAGCP